MGQGNAFTLNYYFHTLTRILSEPRKFFIENGKDIGWKKPMGFLFFSSLLFAGASLLNAATSNPFVMGPIFFINAVGMALFAAGIGYAATTMMFGKMASFPAFFGIYALSSGVTLLAAWAPFFLVFTEPWKWWLIGMGMTQSLGFKWWQALIVILTSIIIIFFFFWSVFPVLAYLKNI